MGPANSGSKGATAPPPPPGYSEATLTFDPRGPRAVAARELVRELAGTEEPQPNELAIYVSSADVSTMPWRASVFANAPRQDSVPRPAPFSAVCIARCSADNAEDAAGILWLMLVIGSDSIFLNSCIVNWPGFFVGRLVAACVPMPGSGGTRPPVPVGTEPGRCDRGCVVLGRCAGSEVMSGDQRPMTLSTNCNARGERWAT